MGAPWRGVHGALLDKLCLSPGVCNPELPSWLLLLLMTCALSPPSKLEVLGKPTMVAQCCCLPSIMHLLQDRDEALGGAHCAALKVQHTALLHMASGSLLPSTADCCMRPEGS